MNKPDVSAVAAMQGRELDAAVARHVMGIDVLGEANCACYDGDWSVFGPVEDDDSGHVSRLVYAEHTDDPWAGPDFAGLNYPRLFGFTPLALGVVPDYSTEHDPAFFAMVEKVREAGWAVEMYANRKGDACVVVLVRCDPFHDVEASADTLPLAFARAALLTTYSGSASDANTQGEA